MEISIRDVTYYAMGGFDDPEVNRIIWEKISNNDQYYDHYLTISEAFLEAKMDVPFEATKTAVDELSGMVADGALPAEEVQLAPEKFRFATNAEPVGSIQASSDPASSKSDSTQSQRRDNHFYYDFDKTKNRISVWVTKASSVPESKTVSVLVLDRENEESLFSGRLTMTEGEHRWFAEVPIDMPAKTKIRVKAGFEEHLRNE